MMVLMNAVRSASAACHRVMHAVETDPHFNSTEVRERAKQIIHRSIEDLEGALEAMGGTVDPEGKAINHIGRVDRIYKRAGIAQLPLADKIANNIADSLENQAHIIRMRAGMRRAGSPN